jgi:hypothetical protein
MLQLYRWLLYVYPPAYRREYGEEMMAVLSDVQAQTLPTPRFTRLARSTREIGGLLSGALQEHLRRLTGSCPAPTFFARRFHMRSEFRFPKATATLMSLILAAIVMAIEKAKAISALHPHVGPPVGIETANFTVLPTLLIIFAIAGFLGCIGWAILFALHRSGMHRLSEFDPAGGQGPSPRP